ncbi:MAG: TetR/AcrR family transcriptional regulator [Candidatus Lokiarchaeota archaeon]
MVKTKKRSEEILSEALKLFVENGYHQTRTSDIAKRVGIAKGTLFNYFKTKEDLLNTLYLESKREVYKIMYEPIQLEDHLYTQFKKIWTAFVRWGIKNYLKILFILQMQDSPIIDEKVKNEIDSKNQRLMDMHQQGIEQGLFKEVPIKIAVKLFFGGMITTIIYLVKFEPNASDEKIGTISNQVFENFLYGARK